MDLRGFKGAYLNNYAVPDDDTFKQRASQVSYVVIKYGMGAFEQLAREIGVPWLAEIYPYRPQVLDYAQRLAVQAMQPGCVGAVVNMESGSGPGVADWDNDNGVATDAFVREFRRIANKPLYASIDTRGGRDSRPYQRVLQDLADGVFPMMFPKEFQLGVPPSLNSVMVGCSEWVRQGKPVIVTFQGYNNIGPDWVKGQVEALSANQTVAGCNIYTIGHATDAEWDAFIKEPFKETTMQDAREALLELRNKWLEMMAQLTAKGTPAEVQSFLDHWNALGKGVK